MNQEFFEPQEMAEADEGEEKFHLSLEGFDGPIDLLLTLARAQKVDLAKISMVKLAEQYLAVIEEARQIRLELAADWLVMAAWLAYLKSRLLLPEPQPEGEPTGQQMADALTFHLRRLEAMREAGRELFAERPLLGRDVFARGEPEGIEIIRNAVFSLTLLDMLRGYGDVWRRKQAMASYNLKPQNLMSLEDALERLKRLLGAVPSWATLSSFLPANATTPLQRRSMLASTFNAALELVKGGVLDLRQEKHFDPIWLRRKHTDENHDG